MRAGDRVPHWVWLWMSHEKMMRPLTSKGITFLVDKVLFEDAKPISVDFVESAMGAGFSVTSALSSKSEGCGSGSCSC